jgi:putative ABC transport system permease protein
VRAGALGYLVRQSLWRARVSLALAAFGVAVGIAALSFFMSLSEGMHRAIGQLFPAERLEIVAGSSGGGALGILGGGAAPNLSEEDLAKIRGLETVTDVQPRMRIGFPIKAWGGEELLKSTGRSEIIGDGIPAALVDDLSDDTAFDDLVERSSKRSCDPSAADPCPRGEYCDSGGDEPQCHLYIPALVSPFLLELYNDYLAPGGGLPRVSRWMVDRVRGLSFRVRLGESYMGRANCVGEDTCQPRTVVMRLSGMSRHAVELGITVPIEYVQRWNREYIGEGADHRYASLSVKTRRETDVTAVVAEARRLGYEIPSNRAQQAGLTITIITALLALTSGLIVFVAAVNIAHTFFTLVHERRQEIGLYRALGATRSDVRNIIIAEAAMVGAAAGAAGLGMAVIATRVSNWAWNEYVPNFPFKPETLFHFTPSLVAIAMGFAVVGCLAGAYLPARRAARLDPARALS